MQGLILQANSRCEKGMDENGTIVVGRHSQLHARGEEPLHPRRQAALLKDIMMNGVGRANTTLRSLVS